MNKISKLVSDIESIKSGYKNASTVEKRNISRMVKQLTKEIKQIKYEVSPKKTKRDKTIFKKKLNKFLEKKLEASKTTYHITGLVEKTIHYKNKYSKKEGYKAKELVRDSQIIRAHDKKTAEQIFRDVAVEKFEFGDSGPSDGTYTSEDSSDYFYSQVTGVEFIDEVEVNSLVSAKPETMFLKSASPINYIWTKEEIKFLKSDGHCVEDNILGIYSPIIKKLTKEKIITLANEFYDIQNYKNRTPAIGYSSECILYICKYFNIPMYAFDIMNNCFMKYILPHEKKNYPVLYFYAINNHMYLVKDSDKCKCLTERAKTNNKSFDTSLMEKDEAINYFLDLPIYENIDVSRLLGYDSCIIIYSRDGGRTDLNDILHKCLELYGIPESKKIYTLNKSQVTNFEYNINKKKYIITLDPNELKDKNNNYVCNWKRVQQLCNKYKIEFKNQSFPSFINQLKNNIVNETNDRADFTQDRRTELLNKFNNKCNICHDDIIAEFHIDHIKPLANHGTNDDDNLQVLCISCHKDKTKSEQDDGSYIRLIETESSFNIQLQDIMDSDLSYRYAFIENMTPLPIEQAPEQNNKMLLQYLKEIKLSIESKQYVLADFEIETITKLRGVSREYLESPHDEDIYEVCGIDAAVVKLKTLHYHLYPLSESEIEIIIENNTKKYDPSDYEFDFDDSDSDCSSVTSDDYTEPKQYEDKIFNIDINKCRKNILYYGNYNLPVFTVMDKVKKYKEKKLVDGIYYVETQQYFPMRGNEWYSRPMIKKCLEDELITHTNIKYYVKSSLHVSSSYYNEFIDLCYDTLPEEFKKLAVNVMIGKLKPNLNKQQQWKSVCMTSNSCEAYNQFLLNHGCFIEIININDVKYFHVYKELLKSNIETEKPIFDQILDLEAIELYELSKLIKSKGGIVLDLNTDCISCTFPNDILPFELNDKNILGYYFDADKKIPKYKLENKNTRLQIQKMPKYQRTKTYIYTPKDWTIYNDVENNDFKP